MISLLESLFSAEFMRAFALTLFHSLWQGALFALVTAGIILILRKHKPALRYAILYLLLLLIPVFFIATFMLVYHPEESRNIENSTGVTKTIQAEASQSGLTMGASAGDPAHAWYFSVVQFFENNARLFVMIWLCGFLFFLFRFTGSVFYVYRLKSYNNYPVDERWNTHLRRLSDRIGLDRTIRLAESGLARIPMTIGYLKPVILLPIGTLSGVPPQQIDAILLHELAHILRKDYLLNIIQSVIELLFFYHPLTWWLSGLIRQEREHICDDLAVNINQDQLNYIKALTTMEELNSKSPMLASAFTGSKKKLLARVKRLITPVKLRKGMSEGIIAFLLLITLVTTLSLNALSIIPSSFDLTGRESGERIYNFLPYHPEVPDTITAKSHSGKVSISVYSDTINEEKQKALQEIAESLDRQAGKYDKPTQEHIVWTEGAEGDTKIIKSRNQVIVISKSDSADSEKDSVVVIINGEDTPRHHMRYEYRTDCPVPPGSPDMHYFYSNPGPLPEGEEMKIKVFSYKNDSIDTLIFINPESEFNWQAAEELKWHSREMEESLRDRELEMLEYERSAEAMQDHMKDIQIEIEHEQQQDFENMEFYFNEPPIPPTAPEIAFMPEPPVRAAEKIIRQELRDDGLTERGRKYVIEIGSKAMYINGEKQPKEIYRKYSKLVESLEGTNFDGDDTFKLIF